MEKVIEELTNLESGRWHWHCPIAPPESSAEDSGRYSVQRL